MLINWVKLPDGFVLRMLSGARDNFAIVVAPSDYLKSEAPSRLIQTLENLGFEHRVATGVEIRRDYWSRTIRGLSIGRLLQGVPGAVREVVEADTVRYDFISRVAAGARREVIPSAAERRAINNLQVPYNPHSRIGAASLMVPRYLEEPIEEALSNLDRRHDDDLDSYVGEILQLTPDQLGERLSPEQIDTLALAFDRMERGQGFLVGHQTGIGKGRIIAQVVKAGILHGMPVVFLTERENLFSDLLRDLEDGGVADLVKPRIVNSGVTVLDRRGNRRWRTADNPSFDRANLLLATYSQYSSKAILGNFANGRLLGSLAKLPVAARRFNDLAEYLEGGILILDESHNAAGNSNINQAMLHAMDRARFVLYSSGSAIARPDHLLLYHRLFGGNGRDLTKNLISALYSGGLHLQELLTAGLARAGAMSRVEHDVSNIDFRFEISAEPQQISSNALLADKLSEVLYMMMGIAREVSAEVTTRNKEASSVAKDIAKTVSPRSSRAGNFRLYTYPNFGSRLYQVACQFYCSLKIREAAEGALEALREGRKPIIFSELSGESLLREILADEGQPLLPATQDGSISSTPADTDLGEIQAELSDPPPSPPSATPVLSQAPKPSARSGRAKSAIRLRIPIFKDLLRLLAVKLRYDRKDRDLFSLLSPSARTVIEHAFTLLREMIDDFPDDLALAPLDVARHEIEAAGYAVGELSGRSWELKIGETAHGAGGPEVIAVPTKGENRYGIVSKFQNGIYDALVMTRAGAEGISLHADPAAGDVRPRVMFMPDPPRSVISLIQAAGRVSRFGQVFTGGRRPEVVLMSSGLPGENRLMQMIKRKLREYAAHTTSNQEASFWDDGRPDMENEVGEEVVLSFCENHPDEVKRMGITLDRGRSSSELYHYHQLGRRLILMPTAEQFRIDELLTQEFQALLEEKEAAGHNPLKQHKLDWVNPRLVDSSVFQAASNENEVFLGGEVLLEHFVHDVEGRAMRSDGITRLVAASFGRLLEDPRVGSQPVSRFGFFVDFIDRHLSDYDASDKFNQVAIARWELARAILKTLEPGYRLILGGPDSIDGIITRIELPPRGGERLLGCYGVGVIRPGTSFTETISFYALLRRLGDQDLGQADISNVIVKADADFLARYDRAVPVKVYESHRYALTGNLFAAFQIAENIGHGELASLTMPDGTSHRMVLMPRAFAPSILNQVEPRFPSVEPVIRFLDAKAGNTVFELSTLQVSQSDKTKEIRLLCPRRDRDDFFLLRFPRNLRLGEDPEIVAAAGISDTRRFSLFNSRVMQTPVLDREAAVACVRRLYELGYSLNAKASFREEINLIIKQTNAQPTGSAGPIGPANDLPAGPAQPIHHQNLPSFVASSKTDDAMSA